HIDEKYDVAISTAIGGYLDYRVVTFVVYSQQNLVAF
ncbi:unnamed protein product, partial [Didymodactylos carnosus]